MTITSNAESKRDQALLARFEAVSAADTVRFASRHVTVTEDGVETRYTRKQFEALIAEREAAAMEGAQEEPEGAEEAEEVAAEGEVPEALPPQASEPRATRVRVVADTEADDRILDALADSAFEVGVNERRGELDKNSARFERGELMVRLLGLAQAEKVPFKRLLSDVNERLAQRAAENALADFQLITEQEATTTRRVVESFGSSREFRLVNAVNPNTGEPLVDDSGQPPLTSIREVPLNKLYALVDHADEKDQDQLLSFAYRYSERVVKKVRSIAKREGKPVTQLMKRLDRKRKPASHPVTGQAIAVQLPEKDMLEELRKLAGEAPPVEVKSIKTDAAWYDAFWMPLKALFDEAMRQARPDEFAGGVSNVFVLERTLGQFFNVNDDAGRQQALQALVEAEDITPEQARELYARLAFNPGVGRWEVDAPLDEVARGPAAEAPADDDWEDDDWEDDPETDATQDDDDVFDETPFD